MNIKDFVTIIVNNFSHTQNCQNWKDIESRQGKMSWNLLTWPKPKFFYPNKK